MGVIIRMNSKTFHEKFLKNEDVEDFQFVVISQDIKTEGKVSNVKAIPRLVPPAPLAQILINEGEEEFGARYLKYLSAFQIEQFLTIIAAAAVDPEGLKIVLLCSEQEEEFLYIRLICEYLEEVYKIPTFSYKKYAKDPKKALDESNLKEAREIVERKRKELAEDQPDFDTNVDKKKLKEELSELDKKALRKLAKKKDIKIDDDMGKKDIIKKIIKKMAS